MTENDSRMEGITFGDFEIREMDSLSTNLDNNSDNQNIFTFLAEELKLKNENSNVNNGENSNSSTENKPQSKADSTREEKEKETRQLTTAQTGNSTTENTTVQENLRETVSRNSNRIKSNTSIRSYFSITHSKSSQNSLEITRSERDITPIFTPKPQRTKRTHSAR